MVTGVLLSMGYLKASNQWEKVVIEEVADMVTGLGSHLPLFSPEMSSLRLNMCGTECHFLCLFL